MLAAPDNRRRIRSYVRREGRITASQQRALEHLWPLYGVDPSIKINPVNLFGRTAPLHLEIGFGMGHALLELATTNPDKDYLGIEVHRPGVGRLLTEIEEKSITNIRLLKHDAVDALKDSLPDLCLDSAMLFFPDPWQKKRHHKRRIVQPEFIQLVHQRLKSGGLFHLATDWEEYAIWMMQLLTATVGFTNLAGANHFAPRPESRPVTKFERRGLQLGHKVWDLLFVKA